MSRLIFYLSALLLLPAWAMAQQSPQMLPKPKQGYILDKAELLSQEAKSQIDQISRGSSQRYASPIYVVTITSLESVHGFDIVTYANELFDAWGVGTRDLNKGILLLVSKGDRKARIALGAGWRYDKDDECQAIMNGQIVPRFRSGDYSGGVVAGVMALSKMVAPKPASKPVHIDPPQSYSPPSYSPPTYYSGSGDDNDYSNPFSGLSGQSSGFPSGIGSAGFLLCPGGIFLAIVIAILARAFSGGNWDSGYSNGSWNSNRSSNSWFGNDSWNNHHHHSSGGFGFGGGSSSSSSSSISSSSSGSSGGGFSGGGGATGSW